jgi:hypothetical protein
MNTKLFELKPCPQCKGTGDAHYQGHDYDCGDCLGTGLEEPAKRIMNLELMLNQHKETLKSSDAHNNELAQKLEIAWEQRDRLAVALWNMLNQEHGSAVKAGILLRSLNLQYLNPNAEGQTTAACAPGNNHSACSPSSEPTC